MKKKELLQTVVSKVNKTINRKAITVDHVLALVEKAKVVKKDKGMFGLFAFASKIPTHFFTPEEVEKLKQSPYWDEFSDKMLRLFVHEGVITEGQASLAKKYIGK